jgi:hypothetical protein
VVNERTEAKVSDAVKRIASDTKASVTGVAGDVGSAAEVDHLLDAALRVDGGVMRSIA